MVLVQQPQHRFCPHRSSKLLPHLYPPQITSKAPSSPYKGSAYRSVSYPLLISQSLISHCSVQIAFGTWAVGDASRRIGERKRGKSATAQEGKANAKKEEGNHRQQKRRRWENDQFGQGIYRSGQIKHYGQRSSSSGASLSWWRVGVGCSRVVTIRRCAPALLELHLSLSPN